MKNYLMIFVLMLGVISCGKEDKKARLDKLMAQQAKIEAEIVALKKELRETGENSLNVGVPVTVEDMKPKEFKTFIDVQGKVDADENTEAVAQTPGIVEAIYVKEGDLVKKGQVLAELDTKVLRQGIEELKTQLEYATTLYNKQKNLWDKNIGSEIQYLTAKNQKESLEKRLATMMDQLEMSKIKAPVSGTVESIPFKVGQMISPGMPGSSIRVLSMKNARIVADLAESYASRVREGAQVVLFIPDIGKEITARLTFVSRYIDPNNRTFKVEARIPNPTPELRANMVVVTKINDYLNAKAIVLPLNVIQKNGESQYVMVAVKEKDKYIAKKREVSTGRIYNGEVEIIQGLQPGDKVITGGYSGLKDEQTLSF